MAYFIPMPIASYPSSLLDGYPPFWGHSIVETALEALSSYYSPTFTSILQKSLVQKAFI